MHQHQALIPLELPSLTVKVSPFQISKLIKKNHKSAALLLNELFWQDADIYQLLQTRAKWIDEILSYAWHLFELNEMCALIAVGGYGCHRAHPYSDTDILVLVPQKHTMTEQIEKFIAFIWDCGLKLGASVRTQDECLEQSADLSTYTNLLSARFITGSQTLFQSFITTFNAQVDLWPFKAFFYAKCEQRLKRYEQFQNTEYSLEPNIKESPGGLRDIDLILWLTAKKYHHLDIASLLQHGDISQKEYDSLIKAQAFLWKIRYALHIISDTPTERLYFEHQAALAKRFGIKAASLNQAISQLMQPYYKTASQVREITTVLCQHFYEQLEEKPTSRNSLTPFCEVINNYLHLTHPDALKDAGNLMQLFYLIAKNRLSGFTSDTIKLISQCVQTCPESFFENKNAHMYFMKLISLPEHVAFTLSLMQRLAVLRHYIPAFEFITGQMQYDLFHLYTVDAHSLMLVDYLEKIYQTTTFDKFTYANQCKSLADKDLLYQAALFHDIGKGQGGNHSLIGKDIATSFCQKISLPSAKATLICWLVENHLLMSNVAQTKDIYDDKVIQDFAHQVKTPERLAYLYLFTVADMLATNPSLWNDWRASLLQELYVSTLLCYESKNSDSQIKAQTHQKDALSILQLSGFKDPKLILDLWHDFDEKYFKLQSPANIAWHTSAILQDKDKQNHQPFTIALREHHNQIGMSIFVFAPNMPNLFAAICACLEKSYLNIVQAHIHHTKNNYTSMSFVALEIGNKSLANEKRRSDIYQQLQKTLLPITQNKEYFVPKVTRHIGRLQNRRFAISISMTQESDKTVLSVHSPDFPGLLARLGVVFMQSNILVHSAIINTLNGQVEDVFYISDKDTTKAVDDKKLVILKQKIEDAISSFSQS